MICAWCISVIKGYKRRSKTIAEAERIVKPGGEIILIENDWQGEFEEIRRHPIRTKRYNEWLLKQGFSIFKKVDTYFKFPSKTLAQEIFNQIWGSRVSNKINNEKVEHKIIVFSLIKDL